jgi:hypothetical protein
MDDRVTELYNFAKLQIVDGGNYRQRVHDHPLFRSLQYDYKLEDVEAILTRAEEKSDKRAFVVHEATRATDEYFLNYGFRHHPTAWPSMIKAIRPVFDLAIKVFGGSWVATMPDQDINEAFRAGMVLALDLHLQRNMDRFTTKVAVSYWKYEDNTLGTKVLYYTDVMEDFERGLEKLPVSEAEEKDVKMLEKVGKESEKAEETELEIVKKGNTYDLSDC